MRVEWSKLKFVHKCDELDELDKWAEELSLASKSEENLLFQSVEKLRQVASEERILIVLNQNNDLVSSVVLWDIGQGWSEVGTVYVAPRYRCMGIGQKILQYAFDLWNGQQIMSTSKNNLFIHIAIKSGMVPVSSKYDMSDVVPLTCVCDDDDGVPDATRCLFRDGACVFLISSVTAQKIDHQEREDRIILNAINYSQ